ncbi:hypothetical protein [Gimesia fumaroli]|uniref:Uncharacterized protein n=1 Tax=Gimesia fumaroli TaxID=2527976 RepID=A0A518II72_9PLAN|nr:hypothetical protein [Gimesia fumaroli]QDV52788.1 hypothetical protein Enr17x_48560 [Gimesia fumaroli]
MNNKRLLFTSFGLLIALSGCVSKINSETSQSESSKISRDGLHQWIGKEVNIQFRRDALGVAAPLPVSPTTSSLNGAKTSISGKLICVDSKGLVIGTERRPTWVPREVILLVEAKL